MKSFRALSVLLGVLLVSSAALGKANPALAQETAPICKETNFALVMKQHPGGTFKAVVTQDIVFPANERTAMNGWLSQVGLERDQPLSYDDVIPAGTELELEMATRELGYSGSAKFFVLNNRSIQQILLAPVNFDQLISGIYKEPCQYMRAEDLTMGEVMKKLRSNHIKLLGVPNDLRCRD